MLDDYPVIVDLEVRWGEMDALGHVNNVMYLQYFETARIVYLERLGLEPPGPQWGERGLIIASIGCRYKYPVTYPDTLSVGAKVVSVVEDRLIMEHSVVSQKAGREAASGEAEIVSYDYVAGQRAPLPPEWLAAITELEGRRPPA